MGDTKTLIQPDIRLIRYLNSILEERSFYFRNAEVTIIGYINEGKTILPNFFTTEESLLGQKERIAAIFQGNVVVYFVGERKIEQMPSSSVGDYIGARLFDKIMKIPLEDLSDID